MLQLFVGIIISMYSQYEALRKHGELFVELAFTQDPSRRKEEDLAALLDKLVEMKIVKDSDLVSYADLVSLPSSATLSLLPSSATAPCSDARASVFCHLLSEWRLSDLLCVQDVCCLPSDLLSTSFDADAAELDLGHSYLGGTGNEHDKTDDEIDKARELQRQFSDVEIELRHSAVTKLQRAYRNHLYKWKVKHTAVRNFQKTKSLP